MYACMGLTSVALPQTYALPASACLGRYLRINLLGKRQQQPSDAVWYTAIRAVTAHGWTLPLPVLAHWRLRQLPRLRLTQARRGAAQGVCERACWVLRACGCLQSRLIRFRQHPLVATQPACQT